MDVYLLVAMELWRPAYLSTNNKHPVMTSYPTLTSCEHYFVRGDRQDVINGVVCLKKVLFNIAFLRVWLHIQTNNELCTQYIVLAYIVNLTLVELKANSTSCAAVRPKLQTFTNQQATAFRSDVAMVSEGVGGGGGG